MQMLFCITIKEIQAIIPQNVKNCTQKPVRLDVRLETGQITRRIYLTEYVLRQAQTIFTNDPISFELVMCNNDPTRTNKFSPIIGGNIHLGKQTIVDLEYIAQHNLECVSFPKFGFRYNFMNKVSRVCWPQHTHVQILLHCASRETLVFVCIGQNHLFETEEVDLTGSMLRTSGIQLL